MTSKGMILIADANDSRLHTLDTTTGITEPWCGTGPLYSYSGARSRQVVAKDGPGLQASFDTPSGIAVIENLGCAVVCDRDTGRIRRIELDPRWYTSSITTTITH
jgi:hypothetical protein